MKRATTWHPSRNSPVATRKRGHWTKSLNEFAKRFNGASRCRAAPSTVSSLSGSSELRSAPEQAPRFTGSELVAALTKHAFTVVRIRGSHQFLLRDCGLGAEDLQSL